MSLIFWTLMAGYPSVSQGAGSAADETDLTMPLLVQALQSEDAAERSRAARELGEQEAYAGEAGTFLLEVLRDEEEDPEVRGEAALSLGKLGMHSAARSLTLLAISSQQPLLRRNSAEALMLLDPGAAVEALRDALITESADSDRLHFLLRLLAGMEEKADPAVEEAAFLLKYHELVYLRLSAASTLAAIGTPRAREAVLREQGFLMPYLTEGVRGPGEGFHETAVKILRFLDSPEARQVLKEGIAAGEGQKEARKADTL